MHSIKNIYSKVLSEAGGQPGLSPDEIENMSDSFYRISTNHPLKEIEAGIFYGRFDQKSLTLWNEKDGSGGRGEYTVASHFLESDFKFFERKSIDKFFAGLSTDFGFHGEINFSEDDSAATVIEKFSNYLLTELDITLLNIDLNSETNKKNIAQLKNDPKQLGQVNTFQLETGERRWDTVLKKINKKRFLRDLGKQNSAGRGFDPNDIGLYDLLSSVTTSGSGSKSTDVNIPRARIKKDFISILGLQSDSMTIEVKEISDVTNTVDGGSGIRLASGSRLEAMKNDVIFCLTILCIITDISSDDNILQGHKREKFNKEITDILVSLKNNQVAASKVKKLISYLSHPMAFSKVMLGFENLIVDSNVSQSKKQLAYSTLDVLNNMFTKEMNALDRKEIIDAGLSTSIANSINADYFCIIHGHDSSKYKKNPALKGKDHFILIHKDKYQDVLGFGSYQNGGTAYATLKNKNIAEFFRTLFSSKSISESLEVNKNVYSRKEMFIKNLISEKSFNNKKRGNQFPDKYKELFSLLKFEQNKVKNLKGFKLLTRAQREGLTGQTLLEVYSSLFKKSLIVEGGLGGHMMHPYEMLDSMPREMINQIKRYSLPQTIVEKVDGQNLFFTVERDGTLLFARNKEDMTHDDLIEKFRGHGAEKPFVEGGNAIKNGVEQGLTGREEEVIAIFHPSEDVRSFINFEIMHPEKPNQIRYDQKYIVFHSIVDYKEDRVQVGSSSTDERITRLINLVRSGIESNGFILASNQTVDLNTLEDVQISEYEKRIIDASSALRISDDQTFADGIMNMISDELSAEGVTISDEALSILRDYVIYGEDETGRKIHSKEFTKIISKEDAAKLRSLGLTTTTKVMSKIGRILMPFKDIFVDLGIDLLKGVKSSYMSDDYHQQNIEDIKDKLQTAIDDIDRYTSEVAEENWSNAIVRLMPHVRKVKQKGIENIVASSVEGGVYSHNDSLMKLTGGFAPMNQIVGAAYRDNEGIFAEFKSKFMQNEGARKSLRGVFSLIF